MSTSSDPRTLALHSLRLKGFADAAAVSSSTGQPEADVAALLDAFVDEGLATKREGRLSGYTLTPPGREEHAARLNAELEATGAEPAIHDAYSRFLKINGDLLGICTDWQLREVNGESVINDHTDTAYDRSVMDRLAELHADARAWLDPVAAAVPRLGAYAARLDAALAGVMGGDGRFVASPRVDSYHGIWFELHEELIQLAGRTREDEVAAGRA